MSKSGADEFKLKNKYGEILLQIAEQKVKHHRLNMRSKNIDEIKFKCKPSNDYEVKNEYLETKIENLMKHLSHAGTKGEHMMNDLRRELYKIEKQRREKQIAQETLLTWSPRK